MSLLSCLWACELYRVGSLHPPERSVMAALPRDLVYDERPHLFFWAVSRAASGTPDRLSYYVMLYT
jgi:hypothetical protein